LKLIFGLLFSQRCHGDTLHRICAEYSAPLAIERLLSATREEYADQALSLKLLSVKLGLSEEWLGRRFREVTGRSFRSYLRERRLKAATELLMNSSHGVRKIALMVGYADPSHFSKDFITLMRCTPSEFRRGKHPPTTEDREQLQASRNFSYPTSDFS